MQKKLWLLVINFYSLSKKKMNKNITHNKETVIAKNQNNKSNIIKLKKPLDVKKKSNQKNIQLKKKRIIESKTLDSSNTIKEEEIDNSKEKKALFVEYVPKNTNVTTNDNENHHLTGDDTIIKKSIIDDNQYILNDIPQDPHIKEEEISDDEVVDYEEDGEMDKPDVIHKKDINVDESSNRIPIIHDDMEPSGDENDFYCMCIMELISTGKETLLSNSKEALKTAIEDIYNACNALSAVDIFFLFLLTLLKSKENISVKEKKLYLNNKLLLEFTDNNIYYYYGENEKKYLLVLTEGKYDLLNEFLSFFSLVYKNPQQENIFFLIIDLFQMVDIKLFIRKQNQIKATLPVNISVSDPSLENNKSRRGRKKQISKRKKKKVVNKVKPSVVEKKIKKTNSKK